MGERQPSRSLRRRCREVKGENHETMCDSEIYTRRESAKHAIRVIGEGAATAGVYDETGEVAGDVSVRRIAL